MNGDGQVLDFRSRSSRGDPFWQSERALVLGMSKDEAHRFCRALDSREREAGRVPAGYAYFPSLARDGRIVLARDYSVAEVATAVPAIPVTPRVVVRAEEAPSRPVGTPTLGFRFGDGFTNGDGMVMEYRDADYNGNPYWRGAGAVLGNMRGDEVGRYLWELTTREREAGRIPSGYTYAKEYGDTGRYVLVRASTTSVRVLR
jgi:hypothetical protein